MHDVRAGGESTATTQKMEACTHVQFSSRGEHEARLQSRSVSVRGPAEVALLDHCRRTGESYPSMASPRLCGWFELSLFGVMTSQRSPVASVQTEETSLEGRSGCWEGLRCNRMVIGGRDSKRHSLQPCVASDRHRSLAVSAAR